MISRKRLMKTLPPPIQSDLNLNRATVQRVKAERSINRQQLVSADQHLQEETHKILIHHSELLKTELLKTEQL